MTNSLIKPKIKYKNIDIFIEKIEQIQDDIIYFIHKCEELYKKKPIIEDTGRGVQKLILTQNNQKNTTIASLGLIEYKKLPQPSLIDAINVQISPQINPEKNLYTLGLSTILYTIFPINIQNTKYPTNNTLLNTLSKQIGGYLALLNNEHTIINSNILKNNNSNNLLEKIISYELQTNNIIDTLYNSMQTTQPHNKEIYIDLSHAKYPLNYTTIK